MDINDAYLLAHKLIAKYLNNARHKWNFTFNKSKKDFGICRWGHKGGLPYHEIVLSRPITLINSVEEVTDTILHEIAHALDFEQRGFSNHDKNWVRIAKSIGCNGEKYYNEKTVNTPPNKYTLKCNTCGSELKRHRRPKRNYYACSECCKNHNKGKYSSEFVLEVIQNY